MNWQENSSSHLWMTTEDSLKQRIKDMRAHCNIEEPNHVDDLDQRESLLRMTIARAYREFERSVK